MWRGSHSGPRPDHAASYPSRPPGAGLRRSLVLIAGALSAALAAAAAPAQQPTAGDSAYARTEAKIPMRDGVKLRVVIFAPRGAAAPLPILLQRTPYNAATHAVQRQRSDRGRASRQGDRPGWLHHRVR